MATEYMPTVAESIIERVRMHVEREDYDQAIAVLMDAKREAADTLKETPLMEVRIEHLPEIRTNHWKALKAIEIVTVGDFWDFHRDATLLKCRGIDVGVVHGVRRCIGLLRGVPDA